MAVDCWACKGIQQGCPSEALWEPKLLSNEKKGHAMGGEIFFPWFSFNMLIYLVSKVLINKGKRIYSVKKVNTEIMILCIVEKKLTVRTCRKTFLGKC